MDVRAFEELVVRHQGVVCGVAYAVLGDRARSEEVAQEAFLFAWQKNIAVPAWICAVARNLARNAARRRREEPMEDEPITATGDARDALIAHEEAQRANAALARLPPALREAVVVYYHGDESMAAVAAALDISQAAAKQRVHRGREQLRAQLEPVALYLRRARPGAAFTGACIALWLSRGTGHAATTGAAVGTSLLGGLGGMALGGLGVLALAGGFVVGVTRDPSHAAAHAPELAPRAAPALARFLGAPTPAPMEMASMAPSVEPPTIGPQALFGIRSEGGTLVTFTTLVETTLNMPLRVADGFDPYVSIDVHEQPLLDVIDGVLAKVHAKRTEIAAVRIVQQGGRVDAASLGGDLVTLHLYDEPMFRVLPMLEPALHMPLFRDAQPGQFPGPSQIDDEWYIRDEEGNLELVPHVTIDLVNVTAGEGLAQILEQTGLGYVRATGYLVEPLADE